MSMRNKMVYRATVQRNSETGADAHENPLVPVWTFLATVPCWIYNGNKALIVDGKKTATIEALRIAFPFKENNIEITEADRITEITDKRGQVLYSGNYEIKQKSRKYTHFEADLKVSE